MRRAIIALSIAAALIAAFLLGRLPSATDSARSSGVEIDPLSDETGGAWARVHASPSDPGAWAELGDAESAAGDLVAAEHAYLTAIRLGGDNGLAYARLGFLHYERNEDDRALAFLLEARRRGAQVPMLDFTIETLESRHAEPAEIDRGEVKHAADAGVPASDAGETDAYVPKPEVPDAPEIAQVSPEPPPPPPPVYDACTVPAKSIRSGRSYTVELAIYGHWAELIIDTGASVTVLTRAYADAVGLPRDPRASIRAITANGRVELATAIVPQVVLADRVVEDVRVAICDECVESVADGLLGLDLVAAFGLKLDLANGTLHFADCD